MLDFLHRRAVYGRRIRVLARHAAELLPRDASVLDVGSGDGLLARRLMDVRPDLRVRGVDVLLRRATHIPVERFDGTTLPCPDAAFDAVMLMDVVHHATAQDRLLTECARAARRAVLIKDHVLHGAFAERTLAFMDWVGNARYGVALPYAYWTSERWQTAFADAGLRVTARRDRLGLYPWPASLVFERSLHFVALLEHAG